VGLVAVGTSGPNGYVDWQWVTGRQTFSAQVNTVTSGTVTFPRAGMGPVPVGTYVYRWVKDGMVIAQSATLTVADIPAVPTLTSLNPASVVAGTGAVTVHVGGSGFTAASVGQVNGTARPTTYVSASDLSIQFSAAEVSSAGTTYSVTRSEERRVGKEWRTWRAQRLCEGEGSRLRVGGTAGGEDGEWRV